MKAKNRQPECSLYPAIEPFASDFINVSERHTVYYEQCGNPGGIPVLFIHGGPGGGIVPEYRQFFDPQQYHIILVDQRGCGKSTPHADLVDNTTEHLISDFEKIREKLNIEKWMLFGGSWGSTLSLVYAQTYPQVVSAMILRGIFLGSPEERDWIFEKGSGAARLFPEYWNEFYQVYLNAKKTNEEEEEEEEENNNINNEEKNKKDCMQTYYEMLTSDDAKIRTTAAIAFTRWEMSISKLYVDPNLRQHAEQDVEFSAAFARLECHYLLNNCFLRPNQLLDDCSRIQNIPTIIVQGRYDIVCPPVSAWKLHKALPDSKIIIVPDAGHSSMETGIISALVNATDEMTK